MAWAGDQEALFDMTPAESDGVREQTEIEYLLLAFDGDKKKELIIMMEKLLKVSHFEVYPELIYYLVEKACEKINS